MGFYRVYRVFRVYRFFIGFMGLGFRAFLFTVQRPFWRPARLIEAYTEAHIRV